MTIRTMDILFTYRVGGSQQVFNLIKLAQLMMISLTIIKWRTSHEVHLHATCIHVLLDQKPFPYRKVLYCTYVYTHTYTHKHRTCICTHCIYICNYAHTVRTYVCMYLCTHCTHASTHLSCREIRRSSRLIEGRIEGRSTQRASLL